MQFRFVAERKTEPREFALRRRRRLTPAQGWSAATTLGSHQEEFLTLKGLGSWRTLTVTNPRVVATLQPWAEISERLRRLSRLFKLNYYLSRFS